MRLANVGTLQAQAPRRRLSDGGKASGARVRAVEGDGQHLRRPFPLLTLGLNHSPLLVKINLVFFYVLHIFDYFSGFFSDRTVLNSGLTNE